VEPREPLPGPPLAALGLALLALLIGLDRRRSPIRVLSPAPGRALAVAVMFVLSQWPTRASACGPSEDPAFGIQFYHVDHLGSTLAMTNSSGAVFRQVRYAAYGDIRGRYDAGSGMLPATESKRQEFTNYETEMETGLQYAHARYYDPTLTQFLSHDPAAQFASAYQYTAFDPVNASDPSGEFIIESAIGFAVWSAFVLGVPTAVAAATSRRGSWGEALAGLALGVISAAVTAYIAPILTDKLFLASHGTLTFSQARAVVGIGFATVATGASAARGDFGGILLGAVTVAALAYGLFPARGAAATSGSGSLQLNRDNREGGRLPSKGEFRAAAAVIREKLEALPPEERTYKWIFEERLGVSIPIGVDANGQEIRKTFALEPDEWREVLDTWDGAEPVRGATDHVRKTVTIFRNAASVGPVTATLSMCTTLPTRCKL
jgi:RHS repeat-associated protein